MQNDSTSTPRKVRQREDVAPAIQRLADNGVFKSSHKLLCYGCGRGVDVSWLRRKQYHVTGYDPHPPYGYSEIPTGVYDYVLLVYLMPRLKTDENRKATIEKAWEFVRPGGQLLIVSRNWARLLEKGAQGGRDDAIAYLHDFFTDCDVTEEYVPEEEKDEHSLCFFARKSGVYTPRNPIEWIDTPGELALVCHALNQEPVIGLDVETTLEEPRTLCTIQIGVRDRTWIIDALACTDLSAVKTVMENEAVEKIIHNALFEEHMMAKHDIRIRNIFDTLPTSRKKYKGKNIEGGHKLGEVCERELGIYMDKRLQTSDWTVRPLSDAQLAYAAIDAEVLVYLYDVFKPPKLPETLSLF